MQNCRFGTDAEKKYFFTATVWSTLLDAAVPRSCRERLFASSLSGFLLTGLSRKRGGLQNSHLNVRESRFGFGLAKGWLHPWSIVTDVTSERFVVAKVCYIFEWRQLHGGSLSAQKLGSPKVWIFGFLNFGIVYKDFWIFGNVGFWIFGVRMPGKRWAQASGVFGFGAKRQSQTRSERPSRILGLRTSHDMLGLSITFRVFTLPK